MPPFATQAGAVSAPQPGRAQGVPNLVDAITCSGPGHLRYSYSQATLGPVFAPAAGGGATSTPAPERCAVPPLT